MLKEKQIRRYFTAMPVYMTERLMLRRMRPCDAPDMFEYASRPDVTRFLTWDPHPDEAFTRNYLEFLETKYNEGDFFDWSLIWKADGLFKRRMIGTCGFTSFDFRNNSAEVGYVVNPAYHNIGVATEALRCVLEIGFGELGLHRIEARYIIGNNASRRVMEKCGMKFEGVRRQSLLRRGEYLDVGVCYILKNGLE